MNNPDVYMKIRTKKLGVLLLDARLASGKTLSESAAQSGIPAERIELFENGIESPTLPEIEVFAYLYKLPLEHFWGNETVSQSQLEDQSEKFKQLMAIRHKVIGANLKAILEKKNIDENEFAQEIGLSEDRFQEHLLGQKEISVPMLEMISKNLDCRIEEFFDTHGIVGQWRSELMAVKKMKDMPADLREFISKPINIPYIELAIRLSELNVNRLRSVAEGLLEITL